MKTSVLLLCALAAPALASAADDQWYVAPFLGGISTDHARDADRNSLAYGAAVGRELGPIFNLELSFNGADPSTTAPLPSGHLNLDGLSLDLLAVGNRAGTLSPFVGLGLGGVRADYSLGAAGSGSDTKFGIEGEVGVMVKLWEDSQQTSKLALRPQLTLRWADPGSTNRTDFLYTVGLQYSFGGTPAPAPVAAVPPPPPPPAPPPPPPPPPAPTPPPAVVAAPIPQSVTLEGVNFATDKADLTADSRPILDGVAEGLKKHPGLKVEIQGHTDGQGKPAYNLKLSQRRAEAVRDYLISDGVPADQLVAKGYGLTQPVDTNKTAAGRARNRRVVMYVLSNATDVQVKGQGTAQQ
jgi:OmpA-OmpF porin, OOP family